MISFTLRVTDVTWALQIDRHHHAARREPSDGAAAARRLHQPRHVSGDHAGAARRSRGFEIQAVSASYEIR